METIIALAVMGIALSAGSILYFADLINKNRKNSKQKIAPLLGVVPPKTENKEKK